MAVKVLILEDNPVARSFLCRVVRESFSDAIAITEAGDLESARREIGLTGGPRGLPGVESFKLILVDLELPDGNGMELLAELAQYPATKIVTTLYSDDDHLFPALQRGADGEWQHHHLSHRVHPGGRDGGDGDHRRHCRDLSARARSQPVLRHRHPGQSLHPAGDQ